MGRGRAKAKQTKVARELKYRPVETDFSSLERELRGDFVDDYGDEAEAVEDDGEDPYADLAAEYEDYVDDDLDERRSS